MCHKSYVFETRKLLIVLSVNIKFTTKAIFYFVS